MTSASQSLMLIYEGNNSLIYHQPAGEYDRPVVIKVLNSNSPTPHELIHFNNEYQFTKDLAVDGVRKAIAQTRIEDKPALVMEYITGLTLGQAFVEQKRSLGDFLQTAIHIAQTLSELHQHHIIHKNITSHNILVNLETKQVKIIDFSLASRLDLQVQHLGNPEGLAGTLAYISPEQSGRMNRAVDYRTDLYSLGVTFYELLTGHLPFESDDPLALVHAHLAKIPRPITALNPDVPPILSAIVMKLLAKNAEDRYQSAFGLKADLERCLAALTDLEDFENLAGLNFELGQDDYSGQFHLLQKLYGRSTEIATLLAAFERAAAGSQELMLVAGYPGVGKSALVAEVHKPITEKRGYFISGKFDQYQQHTPYMAFSQAFNQLADLLLTEPESSLQQWRDKILAAVGGNGAVLTEIIPHLEKVIGPQPAVLKLGGSENRNRFNLTFQNFVQALSTSEHPLVVFIDDWQWADSASLELLKILLTNEVNTRLLLIGAYRDNEVDRTHPFKTTLNDLTAAGSPMQTIQLGNLQVEDVRQLIQESLACSPADSHALTELVYKKTQGNAFFTRQFLQNLYEEGWLHFNFDTHRWIWDIAQLQAQNITNNVVELMIGKLKRLSPQTTHSLQLAACIGNEFDLQTLALISQTNEPTTLAGLDEALTQGLVFPLDDYYKLSDTAGQACFSFLHDRVQQAAYAQIPASERQTVHLEIGRLLLANTPAADLEHRAFDIVQHCNQANLLITGETERLRVAELNMQAADLAYGAAAFKSAQVYLETALALMPTDAWTSQYDMMLRLHSQLATIFPLTGDFERLEQYFQIVEVQAHTMADTAQVKQAKIQGLLYCGNYTEAIELGLAFVQAMGIPVNRHPSSEEAFNYLRETAEWLTPARIETLRHLPEAPPDVGLILEVASVINGPTYNSNMYLHVMFVSQIARLCIEQGLTPWSPVTLMTFTSNLCFGLHDIPKARLLADKTMQLFEERYRADNPISPLSLLMGGFVVHRYDHLKYTLPIFVEGVQKGLTTGTFQFAGYCAWWQVWHQLFLGGMLTEVETISQQAEETCQKIQLGRMKDWCLLIHQAILNLQGKSEVPWILKGDVYDEQEKLALAFQLNDLADVFRIFYYKAWLHYLFDQPQAAVNFFQETEAYALYGSGTYLIPLFYFYDTLANAAVYTNHTTEEQSQILERINHNLEQLEVWVRFAPMNHQHKQDLMEAEKARLEGRYWEATTLYEKAIQGAREHEFLHEEALAYELCGQFWLGQGNKEIARVYLQKAQNLYSLWGAEAKVKQLQAKYEPGLGHLQAQPQDISEKVEVPSVAHASTSSQLASKDWLDIASLLKANQTLSQTVQLTDLLAEMMKILLESAGAERAFILYQTEDAWFIEAGGEVEGQAIQTMMHLPLAEVTMLSLSVCHYVIRSGQAVVLANAVEDPQFATDAYLQEQAVKSILCLPIWHKGELKLVLYLENNLTEGTFTENRLELLQLLSGQMAISLENALMVDSLQTAITERKRVEESLRESQFFLHKSQAVAQIGSYHFDVGTGKRWVKSPALDEIFGIDDSYPKDVNSWIALVHPEQKEEMLQYLSQYVMAEHNRFDKEYRIIRHDNQQERWVHGLGELEFDEHGNAIKMIGTIQDITDRKRAEEALQQSDSVLRSTMEAINDGILVTTGVGEVSHYNSRFCEIWSIPDTVMSSENGQNLIDYLTLQLVDPEQFMAKIMEICQTATMSEDYLHLKDGRILERLSYALVRDGEACGRVWLFRDITEPKRAEEALKQSQALLDDSQRIAHIGSWERDFKTHQVIWTDETFRIYGFGPQEFQPRFEDFANCVHPDDRDMIAEHNREVLATKKFKTFDCRVVRPDGTVRWIHVTGEIYTDDAGVPVRIIGTVQDITERRQVEAALQTSEARYRAVIESQVDLISRYLPDTTLTFVNDAYCQFYGKTREELIGHSYLFMIAPEFRELVRKETEELAQNPRSLAGEYLNYRHDGKECWIQWVVQCIADENGRIVELQAVGRDITERKQVEDALEKSEERLRLALEATADGIWDWDPRTGQAYFSPRYYTMMGYEPDEFPPTYESWRQLLHPDDMEASEEAVQRALEEYTPFAIEFRFKAKNGDWRWILSRGKIAELDAAGKAIRVAGSHTDITARKQVEAEIRRLNEELEQRVHDRTAQLEAANKELEAFSYSVSHDLRAPLRAIDGYTRILVEDYEPSLDAEGKRVCGVIRDQTRQMGQLIDDLLAFSRLSRIQMQTSLIDMEVLVNSVFRELTTSEERKRIDFQQKSLPPAVGDPALIRQVWINLLSNAIKFSAKRTRAVIEVGSSQDDGVTSYYVRDNGVGFDMQYADKLFGVFQRLHSNREFEGTGVGLAIIQRIIHRHSGRVWAEAEVDKGATFCFTLPQKGDG